jgi:SPP1 family predicted phage head-tail adaptor
MANGGKIDQRIQIQRKTLADDGAGGKTSTWATVATVWAGVTPMSGREMLDRGGMIAASKVRFVVRNNITVGETDRISWQGKVYNIREILDAGSRPLYLDIIAERGVSS